MKCVSKRHNSRDHQMIALKSFTLLGEVMRKLKPPRKKRIIFGLILKNSGIIHGSLRHLGVRMASEHFGKYLNCHAITVEWEERVM